MPICSRCGVDQPDEAFSEESQPLCETCYEIELEEEAAGGEVGNDTTKDAEAQQDDDDDDDDEELVLQEEEEEEEDTAQSKKPYKPVSLSNAARITDKDGNLVTTTTDKTAATRDDNPDPPDLAMLEPLVKAIESRGYSAGFGLDSRAILKHRLQRVLFDDTNHVITWLTRPLIAALLQEEEDNHHHYNSIVNARVAPLNIQDDTVMEPQTLLHWLCQWKLLQIQCGWKGHDDMVDVLIRAGANVHATLSNGCTPLFFAVKYGTVDTLRLLIEDNKANPQHKDRLGQTCLRNALPQASPYILKFLLQYIPADETFPTERFVEDDDHPTNNNNNNNNTTTTAAPVVKVRINALDILVTEFVAPDPDVSWVTLGMPSVDDYARCIVLLLQKGVRLSPHYPEVTYFLGHYLQSSIKARKRLFYTRKIADLLFGQWLPPLIQEEIKQTKSCCQDGNEDDNNNSAQAPDNHRSDSDEYVIVKRGETNNSDNHHKSADSHNNKKGCPHCQDHTIKKASSSSSSPLITLYCGHQYCLDHIRNHLTSIHAATDLRKATSCPTCVRPLCQDVLGDDPPPTENNNDVDMLMPLEQQRRVGLSQLTLEQLQFECRARNLEVPRNDLKEHCLESLVADWQDFTVPQSYMEAGDDEEVQMSSRLIFELSLSRTMISQDHYLWVAPTEGSVMIPITVKGIPIMALVSTTSPYTVVSPRFVEMFGFKVNPNLQYTASNPLKFTRAQQDDDDNDDASEDRPIDNNAVEERPTPKMITAPQVHLTAVEGFKFILGNNNPADDDDDDPGIEVCLNSVFQGCEPNTHSFPVGVVLGLDFFQSAAWTQMSVEVDLEVCLGRTIALFTGGIKKDSGSGLHFDLVEPRRADFIEEELRYYSHSGKTFWTPLWHVYVSKYDSCLSLEQYLVKPQPPPERGEPLPEKKEQVEMTECAYCCRKFPFVPRGESRSLWEVMMSRPRDIGMIQCSLCGSDKPTYYCDKECQRKARVAHSAWRHNGIDLSEHINDRDLKAKARDKKLFVAVATLVVVVFSILLQKGWTSGPEQVLVSDTSINTDRPSGADEQEGNPAPYSASSAPDGFIREL